MRQAEWDYVAKPLQVKPAPPALVLQLATRGGYRTFSTSRQLFLVLDQLLSCGPEV